MSHTEAFAHFDGMCWPKPCQWEGEIEWKLRYAPEGLTRSEQLYAAGVMAAYRQMVGDPESKRRTVIRELRKP